MSGRVYLVLVIDDDTDLLATLSDFLKFEGIDVVTAPSGEEGLRKLQQVKPDLIILDISMPGMGGIAFLKEISAKPAYSSIPVYIFTARAGMEQFFRDVNVTGFMAKPCDPDVFLRDIKRILVTGPSGAAAEAKSAAPARRKVLLAEDEEARRRLIAGAFAKAGYEVVEISRGPEIVERAILEKPDVLVTKLVMENMNGDVAARLLSGMPGTRDMTVVLYDDTGANPGERVFWESEPARRTFVRSAEAASLVSATEALLRR